MNAMDQYIQNFPDEVQDLLKQVRSLIRELAPDAEECLGYGIPTFKIHGKALVHFAAFKKHLGFYATPSGHEAFAEELSHYKQGKGSVQFPLNKPIPFDLIQRMVAFRLKENSAAYTNR
ncbi:MAG: iron chaperone [Salinivirgaceae bacterium]